MQAVGLPGFQFIQDPLDYDSRTHHTDVDTYDHLRAEDLRQAAVILATMLLSAANADQPLPAAPLPTQPVDSDPLPLQGPGAELIRIEAPARKRSGRGQSSVLAGSSRDSRRSPPPAPSPPRRSCTRSPERGLPVRATIYWLMKGEESAEKSRAEMV